jgi:myo-inositol-1(or 4)-monophosphatase
MQAALNIAIDAAREAGKIISRNLSRVDSLSITIKEKNDFVSEVDLQAEQTIINIIHRAHPHHDILAEESGMNNHSKNKEYQWIIDPLDGTTNFLRGFPHYSVSIALKHKDRLEVAVIYDPFKDELFCASRGNGATLNDRKIRVSKISGLEGALLATGFPFRENQNIDTYLISLRELMLHTSGIRRAGSAALDLAYVAAGRVDGFWEFGLNTWDMAAGCLIIQEAGGLVGDPHGGHTHLESGNIVAGNPKIFRLILQTLNRSG